MATRCPAMAGPATACPIRIRSRPRMNWTMPEPGVGRSRESAVTRRQRLQKVAASRRKRRLELDRLAALRMDEPQPPRVQEHPIEPHTRHENGASERAVEGEIAVLRIAN